MSVSINLHSSPSADSEPPALCGQHDSPISFAWPKLPVEVKHLVIEARIEQILADLLADHSVTCYTTLRQLIQAIGEQDCLHALREVQLSLKQRVDSLRDLAGRMLEAHVKQTLGEENLAIFEKLSWTCAAQQVIEKLNDGLDIDITTRKVADGEMGQRQAILDDDTDEDVAVDIDLLLGRVVWHSQSFCPSVKLPEADASCNPFRYRTERLRAW